MGEQPPLSRFDFRDIYDQELVQIPAARAAKFGTPLHRDLSSILADLSGIALSGGNVRSATFSLGVFQGLARHGLLKGFDYLSSTGGGAYTAGWLVKWIQLHKLNEVEKRLAGEGKGEAREVEGLRQSNVSPLRSGPGFIGSSSGTLAWLRNVLTNLLLVSLLYLGVVLCVRALLDLIFINVKAEVSSVIGVVMAIVGCILFGAFCYRSHAPTKSPPRSTLFWMAAIVVIVANFFAAVGVVKQTFSFMGTNWFRAEAYKIIPATVAFCCFGSWFARSLSLKFRLAQLGSIIFAGGIGGLLIIEVAVPLSAALVSPSYFADRNINYFDTAIRLTHFTGPLVLGCFALSLMLYAVLLKHWMPAAIGSLFWRFCRFLLCFGSVWFLCSWSFASLGSDFIFFWLFLLTTVITIGGLLRPAGVTVGRWGKLILDTLERLAPYAFTIGLTEVVIGLLARIFADYLYPSFAPIALAAGAVLFLISLLLFWLIRATRFSLHHFYKSRTIRNYLEPATLSFSERKAEVDTPIASLVVGEYYDGPYPLFGAALDVVDTSKALLRQPRTIPFLLSPIFSGFDQSRSRDTDTETFTAYRFSREFGGGVSLADAMTMAQPFRERSLRPPSAPAAMLWTIFNMREGRFIGNPVRHDKWDKSGPLVEPIYALREGYGEFANEAAFIRPSPGRDFDNLSIYQLVKRRCRLIIACDATHDPNFSFYDLGETIRRCRTDLGVEIDMDLIALGPTKTYWSGSHFQLAKIRYSPEETGFMIYIKPSLTGDEPADISQYAKSHPEFPTARTATNSFDESDFESYRRLGEHIVDTLVAELKLDAEATTTDLLNAVQERVQPVSKETETVDVPVETTPSAPPADLVAAIASGECVLCAGWGLAAQAGLPSWGGFVEGLLKTAREKELIDNSTANALANTLANGELEAVADDLLHQLPRPQVIDYVRTATATSEISEAHEILSEMHFLGALNTGMDDLLGRTFSSPTLVASDAAKMIESLQARTFFAANIFGDAKHPSSLAFTLKEFRSLLSANSQFKQFLGTLFLRYTIVFVGSGIDSIRNYLDALELPQLPERKHFALIPNSSQIDPVKARFLERSYNLRIVDYQPEFNFSGLPAFLRHLQSAVEQSPSRRRATSSLSLKSVDLENIGPFKFLHVDLTPSWNLLLGDNGVGKTVLLKAIAVALCGKQVDSAAAGRLLRAGSARGTITLKDENREYTVTLERQDDGSVAVKSASLSPIIYESWLVLGFPALRSVPLERPDGPSSPKTNVPSVEDLLPLLRSKPDDRITNIKQWLINLDYAAKAESEPSPSRKLFNDFFEVLQRLTPDLVIEPGHINEKTMEITIKTDAGEVPLETISQGTGSVMCWIGTLLERLHETGNDRKASEKTVLVLIDELDAHMHPKWQQMFVDAFRAEFTSVQIIATTHSPLLVGSLKPEEIWLVRRAPLKSEIDGVVHLKEGDDELQEIFVLGAEEDSEDGQPPQPREQKTYFVSRKEKLLIRDGEVVEKGEALTEREISVEIQQIKEKPEGWRADQILTSPLFELETTRDPETARLLKEYDELLIAPEETPGRQERLTELSRKLQIRLPAPQETAEARKAYDLIEDYAQMQLKGLTNERRQSILNEVKRQLTNSVTGSRRPE